MPAVGQGAVVIGPRPVQSPSLSEGPEGDALVKRLGAEVWGDCDGKTVHSHVFGKGRVFWGRPVEEVLAGLNVKRLHVDYTVDGKPLKGWPQWLLEGTPRLAKERLTFTTWKHWTRESSLVESGLLGPVRLRPAAVVGLD